MIAVTAIGKCGGAAMVAGVDGLVGYGEGRTLVLTASRQRRQRLCRGAVPHRQIPARVSGKGLRGSDGSARVGSSLCALVQRRASPQRHSLREPGPASCRRRPGHSGRASRVVCRGPRAPPCTLVTPHPQLVSCRPGDAQPRAGIRRRHGKGQHE